MSEFNPTAVERVGQALSVISGDDHETSVRKVENVMMNLVDSLSFGVISSILDEYFPEADSKEKRILREAYQRAQSNVNSGIEELDSLAKYEGTTRVGSATDQFVSARKGKLKQEVEQGYKDLDSLGEELNKPMGVAQRIRNIGA